MKIISISFKQTIKSFVLALGILLLQQTVNAQEQQDTISILTNKDAIYTRPFLYQAQIGKSNTAIGGYLEGNTNYFTTDGVSEGFSMEMRRFNIFLFSEILPGIRFLSELEFEHGTEEIELETALMDFELHQSLIFRAGILLPPIGYFNQNHDSPKWEFIDRPLVSTTIIPSTLSEVGFGFHGNFFFGNNVITYESYLVNGLTDEIIGNPESRTSLKEGKSPELFEEDNNGRPFLTGRLAVKNRNIGELGISYYGGTYNTFQEDGIVIDEKRRLDLYALDYNFNAGPLTVYGETAWALIDVPEAFGQQFGDEQWGIHTDLIYPVLQTNLLRWSDVTLNTNFRFEYVDYNVGEFRETMGNIAQDIYAIVPGVSLRFSPNTLIRANYRYEWERDILGNPPAKTAGFQFGFASYF